MSLIDDIAEKVETAFKKLWPHQGEHEFVRSREINEERAYFQKLAAMDIEERTVEIGKAEEKNRSRGEAQGLFVEVQETIVEALNRLSPSTYPREEAETPRRMHDFLRRFSLAYTLAGKQRSAGPILEYLLAANYDHAFWLWREWIAACVAVRDFESAEALIAVATDGSTPASHQFAIRGGSMKPALMVAKAMIFLHRDADLRLAHEITNTARLAFGESKDAIGAFHAVEDLRQRVESGELKLTLYTGKDGKASRMAIEKAAPAVALLTGKWNEEGE